MPNITKKQLTDYLDYLRYLTSTGKHEIDIWEVKKALTEISMVSD